MLDPKILAPEVDAAAESLKFFEFELVSASSLLLPLALLLGRVEEPPNCKFIYVVLTVLAESSFWMFRPRCCDRYLLCEGVLM